MPKIKIAPSILSSDLTKVNEEIKEVEEYANLIHVDIMDGIFVPPTTVDAKFVKTIKTKVPLDVHLMVHEPSDAYIKGFIDAGAYSITIHEEACKNPLNQLSFIKKNNARAAISIKPNTPLGRIKKYLGIVDMVLVMTVEPGWAGQKFIESAMQKVTELRKLKPNLDIEVDGGINPYTASIALESGANVFVAGSAIFGKKDRVAAIKEILNSLGSSAPKNKILQSNDRKMIQIKVAGRLLERYPHARFAGILACDFDNKRSNPHLEREKEKIHEEIKKIKYVGLIREVREHRAFHEKFGKSYPIEFQANSIKEGKKIPTESVLKDVLFISEMRNYCIISGHDAESLEGNLLFDLSSGDEHYTKINDKPQALKKDDIVLKENGKVITSFLYGPDSSTKIKGATKDCLYLFWFSSPISNAEIDRIIKEFKKSLGQISNKNSKIIDVPVEIDYQKKAIVTPWEVSGEIDYDRLILDFGVRPLDDKILARMEKQTGELHYFLKRKIFFAHTYLDTVLEQAEKGKKFYLYTGRAPSGPVHLGHMVPWIFCKWLQDKFDANLLFQIPDEEKFLFKEGLTFEETKKWANENILDIIAIGFDPKKTKIFLDTEYANVMYRHACAVAKKITLSTAKSAFGFTDSNNIGELFYTSMQSVPAFLPTILEGRTTYCLIPCAIDQQPHFFMTNDVAPKLGYPKTATILSRFLPGLQGMHKEGKMSSSVESTTIFATDTPKQVHDKIMKYAFSGGKETIEEHRKHGGNPDVDVSYQYLTYFLEDSNKLKEIYDDYKSGKMLTGELKKFTVEVINKFLKEHQARREKAKGMVGQFMLNG